MTAKILFIGLIDRRGCIVCGAVLDPLAIDIEVDQFIRPIDLSCRPWRDQDLLPGPPVLRIDDEIMDAPIGILDEEVLDVTDLAVAGMDMISGDRFNAAQMRIVVVSLSGGNILLTQPGFRRRATLAMAPPP